MVLEINQITGKYISKLEQKKFLNVVKLKDATSSVKQAVEEVGEIAKKDIIDAVEPLKNKIAQKDEFITSQKNANKILQNQNDNLNQTNSALQSKLEGQISENQTLHAENEKLQTELKKEKNVNQISQEQKQKLHDENSSLQTTLKKYKNIVKEAYRQGITSEIREQKSVIANILTSLIQNKKTISKPKENPKIVMSKMPSIKAEPVIAKPEGIVKPVMLKMSNIKTEPAIAKTKENVELVMTKMTNIKTKPVITKTRPSTTISAKAPIIKEEIISKIREERKNQVLDKKRMNVATQLIKDILGDMQTYDFKGISEQYKKLNNNKNFGKIANDNSLKISNCIAGFGYSGIEGPFIRFIDQNDKDFLTIHFDAMNHSIGIRIYDENGLPMVTSKIKNGVVKELRVRFNNVKHIAEPEVLYDNALNSYAQNVINQAKKSTTSKAYTEKEYRQSIYNYDYNYKTNTVDYYTPNKLNLVSEYFVNNKNVSTYIANPIDGKLEKEFRIGGNGFERNKKVYEIDGISSITKFKQDNKTFSIDYHLYPENKRLGLQSLYDKKVENKNQHQKTSYEKTNYGLINHPLTSGFSFFDLTQHGIKPWDFSMLNNYIK